MLELKEDNEFYFDKKYDYDLIKKNLAAAVQCPIRKLGDYKNRKKVLYLILKLSNCINLEQLDIIYDIMNFYKPQIEEYMNLLNKEIGAKKALLETLKNRKLKLYLSLKIKYLECDKEVIRKKIQAIDKRISRFKMAPSSITIAKIFNIDPTYINKLIIIAKKKIVC